MEIIKVDKPLWGMEEIIVNNNEYCLKKLYIMEGKHFSLQYHKEKHETFYIEKGTILLEKGLDKKAGKIDDVIKEYILTPGMVVEINRYTTHRCTSLNGTGIITEVSTQHVNSDTYKIEWE